MDKPYTEEQIKAAMATESTTLRTYKRLMVALIGVLLAATAALVVLAGVVAVKARDDRVAQEADVEAREVAECQTLFVTQLADARDAKSGAVEQVMLEMGRAVISQAAVHPPLPFDPSPILKAIADRDAAAAVYDAAVAARNEWTAAGTPLPCPIKAPG